MSNAEMFAVTEPLLQASVTLFVNTVNLYVTELFRKDYGIP